MKWLHMLMVTMIITFLCYVPNDSLGQVSVGDDAPDFVHQSLEGERYQLSDFEGKVVYLFFFGASCPHCEANGPATEKAIYQKFKEDTNFVALGLDTWNESSSSVRAFRETTGISYPLLLNAEQTLVDYYGNSYSYDRSVVIDQEGILAYKGTEYVDKDTAEVKQKISELLETSTNIHGKSGLTSRVQLYANYPNPFNPTTKIQFSLPRVKQVELTVYDSIGQTVKTLINGKKQAGSHSVTFNGKGLPSGVYIYRLKAGNVSETRKMLLVK